MVSRQIQLRKFPVKSDGTVVDVALRATPLALALDVIATLVKEGRAPGFSPVSKSDAGVVRASLVSEYRSQELYEDNRQDNGMEAAECPRY